MADNIIIGNLLLISHLKKAQAQIIANLIFRNSLAHSCWRNIRRPSPTTLSFLLMGIMRVLFLAISLETLAHCFPDQLQGPRQRFSAFGQIRLSNDTDSAKDYIPVVGFSDTDINQNFAVEPFSNDLVHASFPFLPAPINLNNTSPITGDIKIANTSLIFPAAGDGKVEAAQIRNVRRYVSTCHVYDLLLSFHNMLTSMGLVLATPFALTRCRAVHLVLHVRGMTCVAL